MKRSKPGHLLVLVSDVKQMGSLILPRAMILPSDTKVELEENFKVVFAGMISVCPDGIKIFPSTLCSPELIVINFF